MTNKKRAIMRSRDFEQTAMRIVVDMLAKRGIEAEPNDLQLVWYAHVIGNKKCLIYGECMANLYAEVTYALDTDIFYVDLYQKMDHKAVHGYELNMEQIHES